MSKLHVIGIGGTGHKFITAVVHLTACGVFEGKLGTTQIEKIRVLTIDADNSNGNLSHTKDVLGSYQKFYSALNSAGMGLVPIEQVSPSINISLYKDNKNSINTAFNIPQYRDSDDDRFIRFLYTDEEIDAEFDQGFYGHTSIGTLIVKDILTKDEYWQKCLDEINENDFVIVVGSIFGGTGASAIPITLAELEGRKRAITFKFAVVMLTPYFKAIGKIAEQGVLQPDSGNFPVKAKASLYYYNLQNQYKKTDAFYVIGEPEPNFSNEAASRGASHQCNKAHPIELFAATAIIDFIKDPKVGQDSKIIITAQREFKEASGEYYYTWKMLQNIDAYLPEKMQTFMKTSVFYNKVLYRELQRGKSTGAWFKYYDEKICTDRDDKQNLLYNNIHDYLVMFTNWIYDLHKKNLDEIDQNTNILKWTSNHNIVKLFNAGYSELFDNVAIENDNIQRFDELVCNDSNGKLSAKIYNDLCRKPSDAGEKRLPALFNRLGEIIKKQDKGFLGLGSKSKPKVETFPMVPYLSKENNVTFNRPNADMWARSEPSLLLDIADGLPNSMRKEFVLSDMSIPSPWAIFIMNELILTGGSDKKNKANFSSLNRAAYDQWCGLLTLIALRELNLYDKAGLEIRRLALSAGDKFLDTLQDTLTPESYIFDNPTWAVCSQVSIDGETIAFLAHNIIVCPAYSYSSALKTKLYSMAPSIVNEKGEFLSPDNYFKDQSQSINRDAKYGLKLFLDQLKELITSQARRNARPIIDALQRLVEQFIKDIGKGTPNPNISISGTDTEVKDVFDLFNTLRIQNTSKPDLPFLLVNTAGGKNAVLIGLNICGISCGDPQASTTFITDTLMYNKINAESIRAYSGTVQDGFMLICADDLLCDSMIMVQKEGTGAVFHSLSNNSLSLADYEIIWPISEKVLELYTIDCINDMLSFRRDGDKMIVTLKLALSGKKSHVVTKEYRITDSSSSGETDQGNVCSIFGKKQVPFWAAWPYSEVLNGTGQNTWKRYNFFCVEPNFRGIRVLEIDPVFADDGNNLLGQQKLSTISTVVTDVSYRRYKVLPVGLKIKEKTNGNSIYRGAVFLGKPKQIQPGSIEWNIGLDFGTTTTTAFYTTNQSSEPIFIQVIPEYTWIDGSQKPEVDKLGTDMVILSNTGDENHEDYFIDLKCLKQNGYITTYERMDETRHIIEPTIFETGRIFWHNEANFKKVNSDPEGKRRERLLTNIKWENNHANAGKYLNQLLTQMVYRAAEKGVRKIHWFFSYPTAFGPESRMDFSTTLDKLTKNLSQDTGIDIVFNPERNLITESIAAAFYFRNKNNKQSTFLCVDIGGNSSDISIWIKTKHVFQTSIRFASRDMFVDPLKKLLERPSVMDIVRDGTNVSDGIHTMLEYGGKDAAYSKDKINYFIETVLFEYYDMFKYRLNSLQGEDKNAYKNFRYTILIAYSGLVYYIANIIGALLNSSNPDKKIDNDIAQIVFGLSGKGSKLTVWIQGYCRYIYEEAQNLIAERTNGISIRFIDQFSEKEAKTETAIGMVCNLDNGSQKNTVKLVDPEVFIGSAVRVKQGDSERTYSKDDFIDIYNDEFFRTPKSLSIHIDHDLSEFGEFLDFFNKIAGKTRGDVSPLAKETYEQAKKSLWNKIKTEIERTLEEEKRFDPPFIVILKVFLEEFNSGEFV